MCGHKCGCLPIQDQDSQWAEPYILPQLPYSAPWPTAGWPGLSTEPRHGQGPSTHCRAAVGSCWAQAWLVLLAPVQRCCNTGGGSQPLCIPAALTHGHPTRIKYFCWGKKRWTNHQKYVGRTEKTRGDVTRSLAQILRHRGIMTTYSGFLYDTDH